jgi:hypothetical protein
MADPEDSVRGEADDVWLRAVLAEAAELGRRYGDGKAMTAEEFAALVPPEARRRFLALYDMGQPPA